MPKDERIYVKVYYRIEAGYVWGKGIEDELGWAFAFEVIRMLDALGFKSWKKSSSSAWEGCRGWCERLYCHPMDLSGWIQKERIEEIAEVLKTAKTFRLRSYDTYEERQYYSEIELTEALTERKKDIEALLLQAYRTPRKHLFVSYNYDVSAGIGYMERDRLKAIEGEFIKSLFDGLVSAGLIEQADNSGKPVYRTAIRMPSVRPPAIPPVEVRKIRCSTN
ncbi:MAG: hypothetical protein ACHQ0Y_05040 [Thermodesulfovibrionales bacterium]